MSLMIRLCLLSFLAALCLAKVPQTVYYVDVWDDAPACHEPVQSVALVCEED